MEFHSLIEMRETFAPSLRWNARVEILRPNDLRGPAVDRLVWTAVFAGDPMVPDTARWILRQAAASLGAWPASFYFHKLGVAGTRALVGRTFAPVPVTVPAPDESAQGAAYAAGPRPDAHREKDLPTSERAD